MALEYCDLAALLTLVKTGATVSLAFCIQIALLRAVRLKLL